MKLNLGCGKKHKSGYINIDFVPPADLVCNIPDGLPYEDNSVEEVRADNLLEHFDSNEFLKVMNEVNRVLKEDGRFWIRVPDALHWMDGAFGDPTHKRYFVPRSFLYFTTRNLTYEKYGKAYGFKPWKLVSLDTDNKFFTCTLEK